MIFNFCATGGSHKPRTTACCEENAKEVVPMLLQQWVDTK